jgi:uncharacterized protein (DUF1697 family)
MASPSRRYAALLRGVSPMNAKMPELKRCFERAGFTDVRTVLASGNVLFTATAASSAVLEAAIESAMAEHLARTFATIVRSVETLRALLASDPFARFRVPAEAKRVITFFRGKAPAKLSLPIERDGAQILHLAEGAAFTAYRQMPGNPVFMDLIEKTFGKSVTTRTWQTVEKLARG